MKRIRDPQAVKAKVLAEPYCRCCDRRGHVYRLAGETFVGGITGHHTIKRSQGGDDVALNIGPVCGDGTRGCHGDLEANRLETRVLYRLGMPADEVAYVVERKGLEWLNRRYPPRLSYNPPPRVRSRATLDKGRTAVTVYETPEPEPAPDEPAPEPSEPGEPAE